MMCLRSRIWGICSVNLASTRLSENGMCLRSRLGICSVVPMPSAEYWKMGCVSGHEYGVYVRWCPCLQPEYLKWDVSQVTNVGYMFHDAWAFSRILGNGSVSGHEYGAYVPYGKVLKLWSPSLQSGYGEWDVSQVTNMEGMFHGAWAFNKNIGKWDVSKVTNMGYMFHDALTSARISENGMFLRSRIWGICSMMPIPSTRILGNGMCLRSRIWGVCSMCPAFNQNIGKWDVSQVTNIEHMFCYTLPNQAIGEWDVSQVTDMGHMFWHARAFNQNIGEWMCHVTNMGYMFYDAQPSTRISENGMCHGS